MGSGDWREIDRRAGAGSLWSALAFSGDGKFLLSTDDADHSVCLWRLPNAPARNK